MRKIIKLSLFAFLFAFLFAILFSFPVFASELPQFVRVGLVSQFSGVGSVGIGNRGITVGYNIEGTFSPIESLQSDDGFTASAEGGRIVFYSGGQAVLSPEDSVYPVQVRDIAGGNISIGGNEYVNTVEFFRPSGGNITAVNVLTPQEYLYSAVPSEMWADFHLEAQKAQAVAARSYLATYIGRHGEQGFDVCDQGHCVVFKGAEQNNETATAAVDATDGEIIYYEGEPINAVFFSSSGGATDDSENVWTEAVPYLRGVTDAVESEPLVWTRSFSWDELSGLLSANNHAIGEAVNVEISQTGAGGRVLELTIYGTNGNVAVTKEEIRNFFATSEGGALESRNFSLEGGTVAAMAEGLTVTNGETVENFEAGGYYAISPDSLMPLDNQPSVYGQAFTSSVSGGDGVTFSGRGWGHGVGMSQRGAEGLARQGYTYREILLHYYSGVEIY